MKSDWSLVGFTVLSQAAVGTCWGLAASWALVARRAGPQVAAAATAWGSAAVPVLAGAAIAVSLIHLGRPLRAWRAVANLRLSWLSREVLAAGVFCAVAALPVTAPIAWKGPLLLLASAVGALLLLAMVRTYRMRTVPAWDSWATGACFVQSALATGGVLTALSLALRSPHGHPGAALAGAAAVGAAALAAGPLLLAGWRRAMTRRQGAAHDAAERLAHERARASARWVGALVGSGLLLTAPVLSMPARGAMLAAAAALAFAAELVGRELFYRARVRTGL